MGRNNEDKDGWRVGVTSSEATECAVRLCITLLPAFVRACVPCPFSCLRVPACLLIRPPACTCLQVTGLSFRPGTHTLYSCSYDRTVKIWSLDDAAYVDSLFGHQVWCV